MGRMFGFGVETVAVSVEAPRAGFLFVFIWWENPKVEWLTC